MPNGKNKNLSEYSNQCTRILLIIAVVLTGLTGSVHGITEILQGNKPANDILTRIGAFTIIPNYLLTGIFTTVISISVIIWVIFYLHKKFGVIVYFILSIMLVLFGGGIAIIFGYLLSWPLALMIDKPFYFWRKLLPDSIRKIFSALWLPAIIASLLFLCTGVIVWIIYATPGEIHAISIIQYFLWASLLIGGVLLIFSIISGFARDIELRD
ncbi:MAG: hypothetical protein ABSG94_11590 [Brevinematales bacterium]|jgi:hypothetical protein